MPDQKMTEEENQHIRAKAAAMAASIGQSYGVELTMEMVGDPVVEELDPTTFATRCTARAIRRMLESTPPAKESDEPADEGESEFYKQNVEGKTATQLMEQAVDDFKAQHDPGFHREKE